MAEGAYRAVTREEIDTMQGQGCSAEAWERVQVRDPFDASRMHNVTFEGDIRLGRQDGALRCRDGVERPAEIRDALLRDVNVGDNCRICSVPGGLNGLTIGSGGLFWLKGLHRNAVVKTTAGMFVALGASLGLLAFVFSRSGLPAPSWVGTSLPVTILLIGFPIALPLVAIGVNRYWRDAEEGSVFLLGWILGCLALSLSGPFFPYPHRGVFTLQIPLFLVAGAIYFRRWQRLTPAAIAIAVLAMGLTPALKVARSLRTGAFDPGAPYRHVNEAHERTLDVLASAADGDDVLLADQPDVLWLAPTYPGRHYAGPFFLTVDYEQKRQRLQQFYEAPPTRKAEFLRQENIRFLYVSRDTAPRLWETKARPRPTPAMFDSVPGLRALEANREGTLFEVTPTGQAP